MARNKTPDDHPSKYEGSPCKTCSSTIKWKANKTCVECTRLRDRKRGRRDYPSTAAAHREWYLQRVYGISTSDYNEMMNEQGGKCAICKLEPKTSKRLAVDHCHSSGQIRELLCDDCNTTLGKFKEDTGRFMAAIAYIEKHETRINRDAQATLQ